MMECSLLQNKGSFKTQFSCWKCSCQVTLQIHSAMLFFLGESPDCRNRHVIRFNATHMNKTAES